MRSCPVCGLDVEDSYLYCPDDGSRLIDAQAANSPLTTDLPADVQATGTEARAAHDGVVVLYCGECAAEYPMTFVECPVHHVALTSYKIQPTPPVPVAPPASDAVVKEPNLAEHADHVDENRSTDAAPLEVQPARYTVALAEAGEERWRSSRFETTAAIDNPKRESGYWAPSIVRAGYRFEEDAAREPDSESRYENPSYRIVAATLVVALVVFCVAAVYIFFSGGARRQTVADAAQPVQTTPVEEPPPFIPTPVEALDYKQEITVASASAAAVGSSPAEKKQKYAAARTGFVAATGKPPTPVRPTPAPKDRAVKAPTRPAVTRSPITEEPPPVRVERARVDARLIRVRSIRTASGVRYDLTYDLQDESGRHAQWKRMLISTRSASGVSHSQAIPFVHRLGARGALTFTVSVEMRGRSEADWQGRVVCTTTGSDNDGKPLLASFGTNVRP